VGKNFPYNCQQSVGDKNSICRKRAVVVNNSTNLNGIEKKVTVNQKFKRINFVKITKGELISTPTIYSIRDRVIGGVQKGFCNYLSIN
jgi:hypothetical protein